MNPPLISTLQATNGDMTDFGIAYVSFFLEHPEYYQFFTNQKNLKVSILSGKGIQSTYKPFILFNELAIKHLTENHLPSEFHADTIAIMWAMVHGITGMATMSSVDYDGDWLELTRKMLNNSYRGEQ